MSDDATRIGPGRARQGRIFARGLGGERPRVPVAADDLEDAAHATLKPSAFAYLVGGAGLERTVRANRRAFDRWGIVPRVLRDAAKRDLGVEWLGLSLPAPIMLAPLGALELAHPEADLAVARAAAAEGAPFVFSSQASVPMEDCAAAMGQTPRLFQLYWSSDDELTRSFVRRAEACGCAAIVLTVDTTLLGWRPRDLDLGHLPFARAQGLAQYLSDPVFRSRLAEVQAPAKHQPPRRTALLRAGAEIAARGRRFGLSPAQTRAAIGRFLATYSRPDLSWDDLSKLREWTKLPILLKGVLHPDDAREAAARGMDGLIVSNHGGRQIDGEVAALDALPGVVAAVPELPVLFDSGIRTGADVYKALALGARAVLLGRPYAYGLALGGASGVREVLQNLIAEFDLTLGLAGYKRVAEIGRHSLVRGEGLGD